MHSAPTRLHLIIGEQNSAQHTNTVCIQLLEGENVIHIILTHIRNFFPPKKIYSEKLVPRRRVPPLLPGPSSPSPLSTSPLQCRCLSPPPAASHKRLRPPGHKP